jgi:hypothetical protein
MLILAGHSRSASRPGGVNHPLHRGIREFGAIVQDSQLAVRIMCDSGSLIGAHGGGFRECRVGRGRAARADS